MVLMQRAHNKPCSGGGTKGGERRERGEKEDEKRNSSVARIGSEAIAAASRTTTATEEEEEAFVHNGPLLHPALRESEESMRAAECDEERAMKKKLAHHFEGRERE